MNSIISEIIKIEDQAQMISQEANMQKDRLTKRLKDFYEEADRHMKETTLTTITTLRSEQESKNSEEMNALQVELANKLNSLNAQYEESAGHWVQGICKRITQG